MMTANKLLDKRELRKETIEKRDRIPPEVRAIKDREIMERLITYKPFVDAEAVMLFASFRTEVDTFPIIEKALQEGKKVALPRVNKSEGMLELYYIESIEQLEPGYMKIKEPVPAPERIALAEDMEIIVLPGVAFDEKGGRIGYGGGYYDRLLDSLKKVPLLIAVAYEEQIVDEIPVEQHDKRVQIIITEKRIIEV